MLLLGTVAAQGPLVDLVCRTLHVKNRTGQSTIKLEENGDVEVGGSLKVKGVEIAETIEAVKKASNAASAKAPTVKVGTTVIILVGVNEKTAGPQHYQFKPGPVQTYKHPVNHDIIAAWPVIDDHTSDYNGGARFWREWAGYFGVTAGGRSINVEGTPQNAGRFPIKIMYLYAE
jgi:hypothetical protein